MCANLEDVEDNYDYRTLKMLIDHKLIEQGSSDFLRL